MNMKLIQCVLLTVASTWCAADVLTATPDDDRAWLVKTFDELAVPSLQRSTTRPADNDYGGIAWGDSYVMASLAEMLAATGNARYADMFIQVADHVLKARDNLHNLRDEYRGTVNPAWGSMKYSNGKRHVWAVHTGMICEPLARFAGVVRKDPKLKDKYSAKADEYLTAAQQAVAVHEPDYRPGPGKDEAYLYGHVNQIHLPLNMQNALARAWIYIDDATGKPEHRDQISRLARFFKNRLRVQPDGALAWEYRPPLDGPGTNFEDVSHGSINADFLVLCYEHGVVFDRKDIDGLEKTLLTRVIRPDGSISDNIGGKGGVNKYKAAALRWARLALHCPAVRDRLVQLRRTESSGGGGSDMLGCALLIAAGTRATSAPASAVELLGQPCRAKQVLGACVVTDRKDGRERLIMLNDNETSGCELLYIDFEKNTGEVYPAPAGAGSWTVIEVPGDRLVVGTFYDGAFMVFDLKAKRFIKTAKFAGESYIWNLALGTDGRVYGGTYPGGKLGALNLDTYAVEDLGAPAPPNQYLRMVSASPWGQIFANFGMAAATTKMYDIQSKSWRDVPGLQAGQTFGIGVTWNGYYVAGDTRTGTVEAFKDDSLKPVEPRPFTVPQGAACSLDTALSDNTNLYLAQGQAIYHYAAGAANSDLTKVVDIELRGGRFVAHTKTGSLLGIRGQDYFIIRPGDKDLQLRPIPVESRGRPSLFLEADSAGRIWGGPHFGQTLFCYDIATGKANNTGVICDAGGEVYDVTFLDGLVYAASYAGGDITCYNPGQPWDQWSHKNPRPAGNVGGRGYIRPAAGIVTGPDGKLYAGWMARYGTYGGAVSITDVKAGKTDLIENPLGTQAISSIDVDAANIYVGTGLDGNGLPHQKGPCKFGMIDLASRKVVFEKPFDASSVTRITYDKATSLVFFTIGDRLFMFDPKSKTVTDNPIAGLPPVSGSRILAPGDGTLLFASGKRIIRGRPAGKSFEVLIESPVEIGSITLATDKRIYFNHEADLYRTREQVNR
jgi:hypothetical protein